jgi:GNAT superfamily N-acetyltransferase
MGRAFSDDPPFIWLLPHDRSRPRRAAGLFRVILQSRAISYGGVDVACDGDAIVGGAIWFPPGHWADSAGDQPPAGQQLRYVLGIVRALGRGVGRASDLTAAMARHHPHDEHWYLFAIGVDPVRQGEGFASTLLRSRLAQCDADGFPAYLESTKEASVPVYEHFGFAVTGTISPPNGCPPLIPMWRGARRSSGL